MTGGTWTKTSAPSGIWYSIASDSTGKYLAAGGQSANGVGGIYTSSSGYLMTLKYFIMIIITITIPNYLVNNVQSLTFTQHF